ncbi:protease inhibitor I9 family protein [Deinococcus pimensis]|uniref:protease inhibitor I9 family protein n=1 Tax=Deinococcus pimensis TaxID=309888 RepID=UPI00047F1347|nr:protease inhibitor I9 family protein [Deinococcus pimensis]
MRIPPTSAQKQRDANAAPEDTPDGRERYVVVLKDFVAMQSLNGLALRLAQDFDGRLHRTYQDALKAFSLDLKPENARALKRDPRVAHVDRVRVRARAVREETTEEPSARVFGRSGSVTLTVKVPAELG